MNKLSILLPAATILFFSCNNNVPEKKHGAIILGDSSTIVTEKDPKKLLDLVTDLQPDIPPPSSDTPVNSISEKPKTDTVTKSSKTAIAPASQDEASGLKAEFKETTVFIPNLNVKLSGRANLQNANGAVYTWVNGKLEGNVLRITGDITKVSQKYQSVVAVKNRMGVLPLDNLTTTTQWETVKGSKNTYAIKGLDDESLTTPKANNNAIRNAVIRAANRRHINRKKMQEWLNSVGNARSADQKPMTILLQSVMWKIDGKDARGKSFSKQIRIDIPL